MTTNFENAAASLAADKQKQYEIFSSRKNTVQNNLGLFNALWGQLNEILAVGKILYKATNTAKLHDYTFTDLKKRVRVISKPGAGQPAVKG